MGASEAEIEDLYRRRHRALCEVMASAAGSREAAVDVVQDAFAQALAKRRSFRGEGSLEAWVWRIALRIAVSQRRDLGASWEVGGLELAFLEPERDPALDAAVRQLPPRRRLIVFLHYFADLSYVEIARICRISEGTVAAALSRARQELHKALLDQEQKVSR